MLGTQQLGTFELGVTSEEGTFVFGQAQACIRANVFGQAQAFINKSRGQGQARAKILVPGFVRRTNNASTSGAGITSITFGFTATADRILILYATNKDGLSLNSTPSGWTFLWKVERGGTSANTLVYAKVSDGTETSVTGLTWSEQGGTDTAYVILEYSGAVWPPAFSSGVTPGSVTIPGNTYGLIVAMWANAPQTATGTPATGWTEIYDFQTNGTYPQVYMEEKTFPAGSGSVTPTATFTSAFSFPMGGTVALAGWAPQAWGQALARIGSVGWGQAQGYIKAIDVEGFGQARADIKQTYNGHGQSQAKVLIPAQVIRTNQTFTSGAGITSITFGWTATADRILVFLAANKDGFGLNATPTGWTRLWAVDRGSSSSATLVYAKVSDGTETQITGLTWSEQGGTDTAYAVLEYQGAVWPPSYNSGTAASTITIPGDTWGQVISMWANSPQAATGTPGTGWSEIFDSQTNGTYPQIYIEDKPYPAGAGAVTPTATFTSGFTWPIWGAVALAGHAPKGWGQAQACILGYAFGQAQADILNNIKNGYGQAQADILQVYNVFAQTQADILQTYQAYGQAQANIKQTYQGYAQCEATIIKTYQAYGQCQAHILAFDVEGFGQAQASIRQTYNSYGQSQANIKQIYRAYGQAQAYFLGNGYGQARAFIARSTIKCGQALGTVITTTPNAQAQAWIFKGAGYGNARAFITHTIVWAQALGRIHVAGTYKIGYALSTVIESTTKKFQGQAQAYIRPTKGHGQAQAKIRGTYRGHSQAQGYIYRGTKNVRGQAQAKISAVDFCQHGQAQAFILMSVGHGQAQGYIGKTPHKVAQAQASIRGAKCGQAQALIITGKRGFGQAQGSISAPINKIGQAKAYVINRKPTGQAQALIEGDRYFVAYNGYQLPGYAQQESYDSPMSIESYSEPYRDTTLSEYKGLTNKNISIRMLVIGENYLDCKNQMELATTLLRSKRQGFTTLYIQQYDRHFEAMTKSISLDANTGNIHTSEYNVEFEAKPWIISDTITTISGVSSLTTVGRDLDNGGWTPATLRFSGTNVTVSGYTSTGDFTGFVSISGVVNDFEIDTEQYETTDNSVLNNVDYEIYIGPGVTNFTVTGATECTISYRDRWYL